MPDNPADRQHPNDPLHGITLETMLKQLVNKYGWDGLAKRIRINCFKKNPNFKSSLTFLRKTPWARSKVESTSMTAFVAILAIALLFGIQTSINIFDWLTTGEALSNPDSVRHGMGLLGDGLLVALAVYVALVFLRINREETPFFANLPRKIKAVAVLLFATLAVPKWLYWAVVSIQTGTLSGALVDESVMFAFMLAAIVFCLGQIIEYGYLVQDENFEII